MLRRHIPELWILVFKLKLLWNQPVFKLRYWKNWTELQQHCNNTVPTWSKWSCCFQSII